MLRRVFSWFGYEVRTKLEAKLAEDATGARAAACVDRVTEREKKIASLEREVEFYRVKFDEALERADRQLDGLHASLGLPEVTPTTKREEAQKRTKRDEELAAHEQELMEMFAESIGDAAEISDLHLPSELQAEADKLIAGKKA